MNDRQKRFCEEYVIDLNGSRAYETVYGVPNKKSSKTCASRLLKNVDLRNYIEELLAIKRKEKMADAEEVEEFLTSVLRGSKLQCGSNEPLLQGLTFERVPEIKDRLRAAELLGKRYGIFVDKVQQEGAQSVDINISIDGDNCGD